MKIVNIVFGLGTAIIVGALMIGGSAWLVSRGQKERLGTR